MVENLIVFKCSFVTNLPNHYCINIYSPPTYFELEGLVQEMLLHPTNAYRFKYIAILDVDEVIVPKKHNSWSALMEHLWKESDPNTIGWYFRHVYFLDGMTKEPKTSEHLHMLNHIFRSAKHSTGELSLHTGNLFKMFRFFCKYS